MTPDRKTGSEGVAHSPDQKLDNEPIPRSALDSSAGELLPNKERGSIELSVGVREKPAEGKLNSEDASLVDTKNHIFGVFDGMGGEGGNAAAAARVASRSIGEVLSQTSNEVFDRAVIIDELKTAFATGRNAVSEGGERGMTVGTAAKLYTIGDELVLGVAQAGDTRLFKYSKKNNSYEAVTEDQSKGNVVRNGLYSGDNETLDQYLTIDVSYGDRLMLCSDGITGDWGPDNDKGKPNEFLSVREYNDAFSQLTPDAAAQRFLELSKKNDDKTVIVIDIDIKEQSSAQTRKSGGGARRVATKNTSTKTASSGGTSTTPAFAASPIVIPAPTNSDAAGSHARRQKKKAKDSATNTGIGPSGFVDVYSQDGYDEIKTIYEEAEVLVAKERARRLKLGAFAFRKSRETANEDYDETINHLKNLTELFNEVQIEKWKHENPNITEDELAAKTLEHENERLFVRETHNHEHMTQGWFAKSMEKYAGLSKGKKIAVGIGVSAALAVTGGAIGLVAGGALGAAGAAGLVGAKVYKTYAQSRAHLYEKIDAPDRITAETHGRLKTTHEIQLESQQLARKRRQEEIERTDKINKKTRIATAISAVALGAGIASHNDTVREIFGDTWGHIKGAIGWDIDTPPPSDDAVGNADGSSLTPEAKNPPETPPAPEPQPVAPPENIGSYLDGSLGGTEFNSAGLENFHQWVDGYTVRSGDSIWNLSESYLHTQGITNPSVYQIDAVKDTVLADFRARGFVDANGWLLAGQSLRVK